MVPEIAHLCDKRRVLFCGPVLFLQIENERHQRLGHIAATKVAKPAIGIRPFIPGVTQVHHGEVLFHTERALVSLLSARPVKIVRYPR